MPWECPTCSFPVPVDTVQNCPECGAEKEAWSLHGQTRTLVLPKSQPKLEVRRGHTVVLLEPAASIVNGVAWVPTQEAPVLALSHLTQLSEAGRIPPPQDRVQVRLRPGKAKSWNLTLAVLFEKKPVAEHSFDFEKAPDALGDLGWFELQFVCARGDGTLPSLGSVYVLDVTDSGGRIAPKLEISGVRSKPLILNLVSPELVEAQEGPTVEVLELEDASFRTESAVVLPGGEDPEGAGAEPEVDAPPGGVGVVSAALRHLAEHPTKMLLIAGHTDTTGSTAYNLPLSDQRARCALACVTGDRGSFVEVVSGRHKTADVQQILTWIAETFGFDCDPQGIDGVHGPNTSRAIKEFQKAYNANDRMGNTEAPPLAEDGILGPMTWGGFFDCYEAQVATELGVDREGLAKVRQGVSFVDPQHPSVGCGEAHPIEGLGQDEFRSQTNRRVEILFFEPGEEPALSCHAGTCQPELCPIYRGDTYRRKHLPVIPGGPPVGTGGLLVQVPHTFERARSLPEVFVLETEGGVVLQERSLAEDARADQAGFAEVLFSGLDEDLSYLLRCRDESGTYTLFELTPYDQLHTVAEEEPSPPEQPAPGDHDPVQDPPGLALQLDGPGRIA